MMRNIKYMALALLSLAFASSCTDEESHIPATGDLEMGVVMPGNEKVTICIDLKDNSKAVKAEATWGTEEDQTISFDLTANQAQQVIPLPEGSYMFRVKAFDAGGKEVINFPMAGKSYGANYISALKNRTPFEFKLNDEGNVDVAWTAIPDNTIRTVVSYLKDVEGESVETEVIVANEATTSVLETPVLDAEGKFVFNVANVYYPEMELYNPDVRPASVPADFAYDLFIAAATTYTNAGPVDVTVKYLKNAGPNIEYDKMVGDKWGTPKDWSFTPNILNQQDNSVGGWSTDAGGVIHFESDHWDGPGFENGKVWQTTTLPAGSYNFIANYSNGEGSPGMDMYVMAAKGATLPNIEDRASALSFKNVPAGSPDEYMITFTLFEETEVSLGLVITIEGANHWQQFNQFRIEEVPSVDVTTAYVKNAGPQLEYAEKIGDKWGTIKDWSFTPNILNQEDNSVGGWSTDGGGVIHFETDHWSGPGFDNGKVWQTISLPAGTYAFVTQYGNAGNDFSRMNINLAVSNAGELPNIEDFATGAMAYRQLNAEADKGGKDHAVVFTIDKPQEVSVGLVVTITGSGDTYIQFNSFQLLNLQQK